MRLDPLKYSLLKIVELMQNKSGGLAEITGFDRRVKDMYKGLYGEGLVELIRTNKHWYVSLTQEGIEYLRQFELNRADVQELDLDLIEDKERFIKSVKGGLWVLLKGTYGIGKTHILEELMKTGKYIFVMGSSAKKEYLLMIMNFAKRFGFGILVDEIDKMHPSVQDALLDIYYNDVQVIASANDIHKIQRHILSRFDVIFDVEITFDTYKKVLLKNGVQINDEKIKELYESGMSVRKVIRLYRAGLLE